MKDLGIKIAVKLIEFYQKAISPHLTQKGIMCKYKPSCSQYMKEAIIKYGLIKGGFKGLKRFFKCNPFSKGGYDPVD